MAAISERGNAFSLKFAKKCIKPIFTGGHNRLASKFPKFLPNLCKGIVRQVTCHKILKQELIGYQFYFYFYPLFICSNLYFYSKEASFDTTATSTSNANNANLAEEPQSEQYTTYKNQISTLADNNATLADKNQTLSELEIGNINFAKTSIFYAVIFSVIGTNILNE